MTTRTRYFVITSLLVTFVGVGTGLVAYYVGVPGGVASPAGIEDLKLLPSNAQLVAYANVRDVMDSELRRRVRNALPIAGQGQQEILDRTGINVENDIDEVLASLSPSNGAQIPASALVIAHGRFDTARIEGLMLLEGGHVEEYKGARLVVAGDHVSSSSTAQTLVTNPADRFSVAFVAPGMIAIGSHSLIRNAIDQKTSGPGVTGNVDLMRLVRSFEGGDAWAVGRFDALASQAHLPYGLSSQLPAITWFAANADVDAGVRGMLRADARDQQAADDLRDVVRGFIALARLQTASQPQLTGFLQSLTLGGTGTTVSLAFDIPEQMVDMLESAAGIMQNRPKTSPDVK
jgi:hypothetical protein